MLVVVRLLKAGLMHVFVAVLSAIVVGVGVLMLYVLVFMLGVRVRVRDSAVFVLVRVRLFMGVFIVMRHIFHFLGCATGWGTARNPSSTR